jgi:hypothetical protein
MSHTNRPLVVSLVLTLAMLLSGCKKPPEPKPEPKPVPERVPEKPKGQSFVPPTAEQAYRLQDDCTRRGELVLKDNAIGLALSLPLVPAELSQF